MTGDQRTRERAVAERRAWLKVTNACNNNCVFCLDADNRTEPSFLARTELEGRIRSALDEGYERLIVSGGEATMHPDFVELVRYAQGIGFRSIQTITNGRMFAYASFAEAAVDAGLTEVTFSIHGHTAKLHDALTRAPGSYDQALRGIANLLRTGRCVVNVDTVVVRPNLQHLAQTIDALAELGVREFDLLNLVPFGNGFRNLDTLDFDYPAARPHLERALAYGDDPAFHLWTNRFPPSWLEGYESLIQSPRKLHDEIKGRAAEFAARAEGTELSCFPQHCPRCFIRPLCEYLQGQIDQLREPRTVTQLELSAVDEEQWALVDQCTNLRSLRLADPETDLAEIERAAGRLDSTRTLSFVRDAATAGRPVVRPSPDWPALRIEWWTAPSDLALAPTEPDGSRQVIVLTAANLPWIDEHAAALAERDDFEYELPTYARLAAAREAYTGLLDVLQLLGRTKARIWQCPPCLSPGGAFREPGALGQLPPDGARGFDAQTAVARFVADEYFVRSERCVDCINSSRCRGAHLNLVRLLGFGILQPVAEG